MQHTVPSRQVPGVKLKEIFTQGGPIMEKVTCSLATAALLASALCPSVLGHTKHAPLPEQILQAKAAYIDNQTGFAELGDRAYDEVSKWGRFKIVKSAKDADVVFLLSAQEYAAGYRTSTTGTSQGTMDDTGNVALSHDSTSHTTAQMSGITFLTVLDPKSGKTLWSDAKSWGRGITWMGLNFGKSATRSLVKELRERVEEQEAESKGKSK